MELYIISHKEFMNEYLGTSRWKENDGFHWTTDLFFAVFGSDEKSMELYYTFQLSIYPTWLSNYHVRKMTEAENEQLIKHQTHHYKLK